MQKAFWKAVEAIRTLKGAMNSIANIIEPAVSYVREQFMASKDQAGPREVDLDEALSALTAVRFYLDIFRPPEYTSCNPGEWLKTHASEIRNERCSLLAESTSAAVVDPSQAWACLATLVDSVELYEDAILIVEVFEEDAVPRITLGLDGPGVFPARLLVGGLLPIEFETLCQRWTIATRGGKIQRTPSGMELRLKGMREPAASDESILPLVEAFAKVHAQVKACMRAQNGTRDSKVPVNKVIEDLDRFLAMLDGDVRIEPSDVPATVRTVVDSHGQEIAERSIAVNVFVEMEIPPIAVARGIMVRVWRGILQHAFQVLPRGGRVSFLVDYNQRARRVSVTIEMEGTQCESHETIYLASIRRGVREVHGGDVEFAAEKNGLLLRVLLPDRVAETLDAWLPGWDRFSEQSQQMLRLLKSGGPTPPEEFLLGGILENELERWLLPLLTEPAVVNIVHDSVGDVEGVAVASSERLEKVLTQIKRGKPKKEIVRPAYAGELLWAFRESERSRKALHLDQLDDESLRELCRGLVQSPVDYTRCLRYIARVIEVD
jgi:hypothetical protein